MTPQEWMWIYDAKVGDPKVPGTSMTESEADELYQDLLRG